MFLLRVRIRAETHEGVQLTKVMTLMTREHHVSPSPGNLARLPEVESIKICGGASAAQ